MKRQAGHAALLFAMIIPALFGLFTLASDGARALQANARIDDATEVATLAVSAHNADNTDSNGTGSGSQVNRQIATNYLDAYMQDMQRITDLQIYRLTCEDVPECAAGLQRGEPRFFQYQVVARTEHNSWFPGNDAIDGFGETFEVGGSAVARKYQNDAVDVIFAADFSGSMKKGWSGGNQAKYKDLVSVIKDVSEELQKFNNLNNAQVNMIGIAPFNFFTRSHKRDGRYCYVDQLVVRNKRVNYSQTIRKLFETKTRCMSNSDSSSFNDLALTDQFSKVNNRASSFKPDNGTASYQGIIRGSQILKQGNNPRRLLIVLSDGQDEKNYTPVHGRPKWGKPSYKQISENLIINHGMCDEILRVLGSDYTSDGRQINAKMAVVGFDYDVNSNVALKECVGENNVYRAQDRDEILNNILELITEEIGHLK